MRLFFSSILLFTVLTGAPWASDDPMEQYNNLQEKITSEQERLKKIKKHEHSILGELDRINRELSEALQDLRKYRGAMEKTRREISATQAEISTIEEKLKRQKNWMKRKLRAMHKYGSYRNVAFIIGSSDSLAALMRRLKYLEILTRSEQGIIEGYRADLERLNEKKTALDRLYGKLKKDEEKVSALEGELSARRDEKQKILVAVKTEKASYEQMLRELREASERLLELIRKSEQDIEAAYKGEGFRALKGMLIWPVAGHIAIPYGTQKDPKFNTPIFRNGIYIKAAEGDPVRAVFKGKVVYADWFKGYGRLVIINHGEGYNTLYANLSEIFLKVGDIIEVKAPVGRIGESSAVDASSLYFEVRYKGKPLDPAQWLKKR